MRIASIKIANLAAFSTPVEFKLGSVSLIQGDHAVGKTSLRECALYAFGRRPLAEAGARGIEHDPSMIHGNEERGEATITFDDGMELRVLVTADKTTRTIKGPEEKRYASATPAVLDSLVNALSYDPFTFKTLTEKQRVEALLKASPVTVTSEELNAAAGYPVTDPPSLESINAIHDDIYSQRTIVRREEDTLTKHADELAKAVPAAAEGQDWQATRAELSLKRQAMDKEETDLIAKVGKTLREHTDSESKKHQANADAIDAEINEKIAALEAERARRRQASMDNMNQEVGASREIANKTVKDHRAAALPIREQMAADLATAEANANAAAQGEGTRKAEATARAEATLASVKVTDMTAALGRLAKLKIEVAGRLAVPGVTIASPKLGQPVDICRTEKNALVPFSKWNEADKEKFCLRMAVLFHGKCGVVFVDEIGHFTEERRAALIKAAKGYAEREKMQFLFGQAVPGPLKVVEA